MHLFKITNLFEDKILVDNFNFYNCSLKCD